ncbi:MAG TPA: zinc-ribbon domain-containing protein [Oscillospiraceae bacterium]|jgi:oligoribonuclease NrnB/cAMP/cGMP phosphodiesterase (DHH superfamily)|nr:zinc-ribbon domain-containing protein [Oscillospiraceae bacterium]HRW56905.1 zinc-ribbon domain-containing protein [Oscillospiraceae bacterium]
MAFLDKLNDLAKTAVDKTGNAIENGKISVKITGEERNIAAATAKIGEYYLAKLDAGEVLDDSVMEIYAEIEEHRRSIEAMRAELGGPKNASAAPADAGVKFCKACGAKVAPGTKFCPECGAEQ